MNPLAELKSLTDLFPSAQPLFDHAEHIASSLTPSPYRELLAHEEHMTVTMEQFHRTEVEVRVLAAFDEPGCYTRKITLVKAGTEDVVQFGIVRFDFQYVTDAVRSEILAAGTPLGKVLIRHNVLRHIDLGAVLKLTCGGAAAEIFRCPLGTVTYGRLATIFCNGSPAVDLLEVSAPLESLSGSAPSTAAMERL